MAWMGVRMGIDDEARIRALAEEVRTAEDGILSQTPVGMSRAVWVVFHPLPIISPSKESLT